MSHSVRLIIGRPGDVEAFASRWPHTLVSSLPGNWAAAPLTDELYDALAAWRPGAAAIEAFDMAPPGLAEALAEATASGGPLAYAETEYFGGTGDQSSGAWAGGKLLQAERGHGAINSALHAIGVTDAQGMDAFDTIGLGRKRSNEDYLRPQNRGEVHAAPASATPPAKGLPLWLVAAVIAAAIGLGLAVAVI